MSPNLLMPDPQEARASGWMDAPYADWRKWWGKNVAKTARLGRRKRPEPGELPIIDPENG